MIPIPTTPADDLPDVEPERALWFEVLWQAIHDAKGPTKAPGYVRNPSASTTSQQQHQARAWLADVKQLAYVCDKLEIDPHWVQTLVRRQYPEILAEEREGEKP
jgi:hypothetical protein